MTIAGLDPDWAGRIPLDRNRLQIKLGYPRGWGVDPACWHCWPAPACICDLTRHLPCAVQCLFFGRLRHRPQRCNVRPIRWKSNRVFFPAGQKRSKLAATRKTKSRLAAGFADEVAQFGQDDLLHRQLDGGGRAGHGEHDGGATNTPHSAAQHRRRTYLLKA